MPETPPDRADVGDDGHPPPGTSADLVAPDVAAELPDLRLFSWTVTTAWPRRSPAPLRDRLAVWSDRVDGPAALGIDEDDTATAHQQLLHAIGRRGVDRRSPLEVAYHRRIRHGRFRPRNAPQDVVLVVLLETGVPIWALDAATIQGDLRLRRSTGDELDGPGPSGREPEPVLADATGVVAELGRDAAPLRQATRRTTRTTFCCARVPGLPGELVAEAVRLCRTLAGHGIAT